MKVTVLSNPAYSLAVSHEEVRYLVHILGKRSTGKDREAGFDAFVSGDMYVTLKNAAGIK